MDTVTLVENEIDEGQRLLDRLAEERFRVIAACWMKPSDQERWSLYICTPEVEKKGLFDAYFEVNRVARSLESAWITSADIKLVGENHPLSRDLREMTQRFGSQMPVRTRHAILGGLPVDEVFVYPNERKHSVDVTVYGLIFKGEPRSALHLSLEPHPPNCKLTVESQNNRDEFPGETGIDWLVAAPEGSALERDENGLMALAWNLRGKRVKSNANEVWSFAKLGQHGFSFIREPLFKLATAS